MDEIPQVQNAENPQVENTQPVIQSPIDQPSIGEPPKGPGAIRKIFNASSWFVFFALLPVTVLILLSQSTIPGDLFYPIKRGMENVVLAAASVSPATRVAFRTDLTERRFDEAEKLLLARGDTTGLSDFVEEVQKAQEEASTLSNLSSKQELTENLIKKIDEYKSKLVQVKAKTETTTIAASLPTNTPLPTLAQSDPTSVAQPTPTSLQNPTVGPFIRLTPTPTSITKKAAPTSAQQIISPKPTGIEPSVTRSIEQISVSPTIEPSPTQVQIEPTITVSPNLSNDNIETAIDDTQKRLDKIKDKLKERREEKVEKEKKIKEEKESTDVNIKDEEKKAKDKGKK